jgi:hypothetical protein
MLRLVILSVLLISLVAARAQETVTAVEIKDSTTTMTTTIKAETEAPVIHKVTTTIPEASSSMPTSPSSTTIRAPSSTVTSPTSPSSSSSSTESDNSHEENSHESSEEDNGSNEHPLVPIASTPPKRKVLYINQQQSGKLNVHLELNDVSLIVIPNKKDPQLSLLNLLLRSAQKSNLKHNEEKKKEENAKVHVPQQDDDYSQKYKMDNYMHAATNEPAIESRAPYRVDISSTLGQQPVVDIMNNGKFQSQAEYARSPMVKLLRPIAMQQQPHGHGRIFKRSIDTSFLRFNPDVLDDTSISQNSSDSEEELELINSLESNQNINGVEHHQEDLDNGGGGFMLLGAVEDCGPGRHRNSYMICVAIDE